MCARARARGGVGWGWNAEPAAQYGPFNVREEGIKAALITQQQEKLTRTGLSHLKVGFHL